MSSLCLSSAVRFFAREERAQLPHAIERPIRKFLLRTAHSILDNPRVRGFFGHNLFAETVPLVLVSRKDLLPV